MKSWLSFHKSLEPPSSTGTHFAFLDGIRGMAILLVVIYHVFYTNPAAGKFSEFAGNLIRGGWMGVPLFFVLSGFLISYPFFRRRREEGASWYVRGYAVRRIAKIIPPFYFSILIFSVFYWFQFHEPVYWKAAWHWATGLESYALPVAEFNLSYWSLMVEAHFYMVLPLLFFLTRRLGLAATTAWIAAGMLMVPCLLQHLAWPAGCDELNPSLRANLEILFFIQRFPFCLLDFFAFGLLFAGLFASLEGKGTHRRLALFGYLGVVMLAATLVLFALDCQLHHVFPLRSIASIERYKYLPALSGCLMLFFIFDPQSAGARWFSIGWLRLIGIVSYEWFLFHGPICVWFRDQFGHTNGNVIAFAGKTILPTLLTLAFSILFYKYFSLPILNRVRDHLKTKPKGDNLKVET